MKPEQGLGLNETRPRLLSFCDRIANRPAYRRAIEAGGPYHPLIVSSGKRREGALRSVINASDLNPLVAILIYDGLATFEYGIAVEVFGLPRPDLGPGWYRLTTCAVEEGPLRAEGGIWITAETDLATLNRVGTIVVPGWPTAKKPSTDLLDALRSASFNGTRIISICTGAFLLAEAGLLDGRCATLHWSYIEEFLNRYPKVKVDPESLYAEAGTVLTSAGSAAAIDLLLHVVRSDFGVQIANHVAQRLLISSHRESRHSQLMQHPIEIQPEGRLGLLLEAMRARLDTVMTSKLLAKEAAMSERTFLRRFRELTGATPAAWLINERIRAAKYLLRQGALSVECVAEKVGFGSAAKLRGHFRKSAGMTPTQFRRSSNMDR